MSDHADFLAEILANPDDITARLVYADWLEERADPRSEFIRVQCRLAELTEEDAEYRKLEERSLQFIRKYKEQWVADIAPLVFSPRLTRGFVEEISVGCKQLAQHHRKLFQLAPIRHVNVLRLNSNWVDPLRNCPEWRQVRSLDLSNQSVGPLSHRLLLGSQHFTHLEQLKLCYTDPTFLHETDAPPTLATLRELALTGNGLKTPSAFARWWVGRLAALECLRLDQCQLTGPALTEMLSHTFPRLRALHLAHNPLGDEGAAAIARCSRLDRLETLELQDTNLGTAGFHALAESLNFRRLRSINLSQSRPSPAAIEFILDAVQPTTLRLNDCHLTDGAVSILASASTLSNLRILELQGSPRYKGLTNSAALALLDSPYLTKLTTLNLRHSAIDADVQRQLRARFGVGVCTFSEPPKRR